MRRMWVLVLATVALLGLVSQAPAAAATPAQNGLFCQVLPGNGAHQGACTTATPPPVGRSYAVDYTISGVAVVGWAVPAAYQYTAVGCVANVNYCNLSVNAQTYELTIPVTVYYQLIATGGAVPTAIFSFSSSATATIPAFCGRYFC